MMYFLTKQEETFDYNTSADISYVVNFLKTKCNNIFVLDTETTGLEARTSTLLLIQVGNIEKQFVIDVRTYTAKQLEPLMELLEDSSYIKIAAYGGFEYKLLKWNYGVTIRNLRDVLLNERVIHCGVMDAKEEAIYKAINNYGRYSMEGLVHHYFDESMQKNIRATFVNHRGDFNLFQIRYAGDDISTPFRLIPRLDYEISRYNLNAVTSLEDRYASASAEMEYNGITLDEDRWSELERITRIQMGEAEIVLDKQVMLDSVKTYTILQKYIIGKQLGMFADTDGRECSIKWGSAQQRIKVLEEIGVDVWAKDKKTKEFKRSSAEGHISQFSDDFELVPMILKFTKLKKSVDAFGKKFLEYISDVTGRIHTSYHQIKATGRISSSNPNMQNQKRDNAYRRCFVAVRKDMKIKGILTKVRNKLITADYSNMELRIMADKALEYALIEAFNAGHDVHSLIATKIYKAAYGKSIEISKTVNSDIRYQFKTITFALAYGAQAYTLHKELDVTIARAQELIDLYFLAFPKLKTFFSSLSNFGLARGYVRTYAPFYRIRWFPQYVEYKKLRNINRYSITDMDRTKMYILRGSIEREAMNTPIQGTSADVVKQAGFMLHEYYYKFNKEHDLVSPTISFPEGSPERIQLLLQVHDEYVTECGEGYAEEIADNKIKIMELAGKDSVEHLSLTAEFTIANEWQK